MEIFISYGHDKPNAEFVKLLKKELEQYNSDFHIWIDLEGIGNNADWRQSICDAIYKSDAVLACMSKYSTRDPGVCLDELRISVAERNKKIASIILEPDVQPPLSVAHIQYLDLMQWRDQCTPAPENLNKEWLIDLIVEEWNKGDVNKQWLREFICDSWLKKQVSDEWMRKSNSDGWTDESNTIQELSEYITREWLTDNTDLDCLKKYINCDWISRHIDKDWLAEQIENLASRFSGAEEFRGEIGKLQETLKVDLRVGSYLDRLLGLIKAPFVGRDWIFKQIDSWLQEKTPRKVFCITGEPGFGKSAMMAQYAAHSKWQTKKRLEKITKDLIEEKNRSEALKNSANQDLESLRKNMEASLKEQTSSEDEFQTEVAGIYFCSSDSGLDNPRMVMLSLAFQMGCRMSEYRKYLINDAKLNMESPEELFKALFLVPLKFIPGNGKTKYVLIVDALDEASGELSRFIAQQQQQLPPWLFFLVTSRPEEAHIKEHIKKMNPHVLKSSDEENKRDAEAYIDNWFNPEVYEKERADLERKQTEKAKQVRLNELIQFLKTELPPYKSDLRNKIMKESACNFRYLTFLRLMTEDKAENLRKFLSPGYQFPGGLTGLYTDFMKKNISEQEYKQYGRPVLSILAAFRVPMPLDLLCDTLLIEAIAKATEKPGLYKEQDRFNKHLLDAALKKLGSLIRIENGYVSFFHKSVIDWLYQPENTFYRIKPGRAENILIDRLFDLIFEKTKYLTLDDSIFSAPFYECGENSSSENNNSWFLSDALSVLGSMLKRLFFGITAQNEYQDILPWQLKDFTNPNSLPLVDDEVAENHHIISWARNKEKYILPVMMNFIVPLTCFVIEKKRNNPKLTHLADTWTILLFAICDFCKDMPTPAEVLVNLSDALKISNHSALLEWELWRNSFYEYAEKKLISEGSHYTRNEAFYVNVTMLIESMAKQDKQKACSVCETCMKFCEKDLDSYSPARLELMRLQATLTDSLESAGKYAAVIINLYSEKSYEYVIAGQLTAQILAHKKQWSNCLTQLKTCISILEEIDNPAPNDFYELYANALLENGEAEQALLSAQKELERDEKFFGIESEDCIRDHELIAKCYRNMGKDKEAEGEYLESIRISELSHGMGIELWQKRLNIAKYYIEQEQWRNAAEQASAILVQIGTLAREMVLSRDAKDCAEKAREIYKGCFEKISADMMPDNIPEEKIEESNDEDNNSSAFANMGQFAEAFIKDPSILRHISGFSPELCEELGKMRMKHDYFADSVKTDAAFLKGASQNEDFDWNCIPKELYNENIYLSKLQWLLFFRFSDDCRSLMEEMEEQGCLHLQYQNQLISLEDSINILSESLESINQFQQLHPVIMASLCFITTEDQYSYANINPEFAEKMAEQNIDYFPYIREEKKTYELCMTAVENDRTMLQYVPEDLKTPEICMAAVQRNGYALQYVPADLKTPEICLAAVKDDGFALEYVPKDLKIPEICLVAVQQDGRVLKYVPESLMTPEMCMEAVKDNGFALQYVPKELKTPEICLAAVKQDGDALKYVQGELQSLEMCLIAVKNHVYAFEYVSKQFRTPDICIAGILFADVELNDIPKETEFPYQTASDSDEKLHYRNMRAFIKAYRNNTYILKNITGFSEWLCRIIVHSLDEIALKLNNAVWESDEFLKAVAEEDIDWDSVPSEQKTSALWFARLEYVIKEKYTDDIEEFLRIMLDEKKLFSINAEGKSWNFDNALKRLEQNPSWIANVAPLPKAVLQVFCCINNKILSFLPQSEETGEIMMSAVQQDGYALEYVPADLQTPEICLAAVQKNGDALQYVPKELKTPELCMEAVKQDGSALRFVPETLKTPDICLASVQRNGDALQYVPKDLKMSEICLAAVKQDGLALYLVPETLKTPEIYMAAVKQNGYTLQYLPADLKTPEICLATVQQDSSTLDYVPEDLKTSEICMAAVKGNGNALQYVPEDLKTSEICMAAVKGNGNALQYVPEPLKTSDMCMAAVKDSVVALEYVPLDKISSELALIYLLCNYEAHRMLYASAFEYNCDLEVSIKKRTKKDSIKYLAMVKRDPGDLSAIPLDCITPDICLAAVQQAGLALDYVPSELKTPELCMAAVQQNGNALHDVPESLKTPEMCMTAVKQDGRALDCVPKGLKTPEICMEAVKSNGFALEYVPSELKTSELCMTAVKQNGEALYHVPEDLKTSEMFLTAVKQNGNALQYFPESFKTSELCMTAVKQDGNALNDVPENLKTSEMCLAAVKSNGRVLNDVPENLKTPEMCMAAVKGYGNALNDVPENLKTSELCMAAVKGYGNALQYVPESFKTSELCMAAVKEDGDALEYVPKELKTPEICLEAVNRNGWVPAYVPEELCSMELLNIAQIQRYLNAAEWGFKDIVEQQIQQGADVNAKNYYGKTALILASENGYCDIVELLIAKGADVNAKDNAGKTAVDYALENGHNDIVNLLKQKQQTKSNTAEENSRKADDSDPKQEKKQSSAALVKGQRVELTKNNPLLHNLTIGFGWEQSRLYENEKSDIDAAAFLLNKNEKVTQDADVVFYGNMSDPSQSVTLIEASSADEVKTDKKQIAVDLALVPDYVEKIAVALSIYEDNAKDKTFAQVVNVYLRIIDSDTNEELFRFELGSGFHTDKGILAGELYRYKGQWKFSAVDIGFSSGLADICRHFGVDIE